jgi:hypothetical protein
MISLHITFHLPSSNGLLVIDMKAKTKYRSHTTSMLLLYILHKITLTKFAYILKTSTKHHFSTLNYVALVSFSLHKFVLPPCCCYYCL